MRPVGERVWYRAGNLLGLTIRLWRSTLRFESRNHEALDDQCIMAFWHGRLAGPMMDNIGCGAVSMASRSKDGAMAAGALSALGLGAARGSSSRGGREALRDVGAMMNAGAPFTGLTVDGPRGPWRQVKPGVVVLARRLEMPLVPASFSTTRPRLLRSWDRMVLPRPFSRVVVRYGTPWPVERLHGDLDEILTEIGQELDRLGRELDLEVAGRDLWDTA